MMTRPRLPVRPLISDRRITAAIVSIMIASEASPCEGQPTIVHSPAPVLSSSAREYFLPSLQEDYFAKDP